MGQLWLRLTTARYTHVSLEHFISEIYIFFYASNLPALATSSMAVCLTLSARWHFPVCLPSSARWHFPPGARWWGGRSADRWGDRSWVVHGSGDQQHLPGPHPLPEDALPRVDTAAGVSCAASLPDTWLFSLFFFFFSWDDWITHKNKNN